MKVNFDEHELNVLRILVKQPGSLDAEAIGQTLWRPKITPTNYLQVRKAIIEHGASWSARASTILHRLVEAELVERQRPPQVAQRWQHLARRNPASAIAEAASSEPSPDPSGRKAELLGRLAKQKPATMEEWLGKSPPGNIQRAVQDLIEWGLVIPPAFRWPTKAGVDLIKGMVPEIPACGENQVAG
ncbi:MAG TPA: hypothetical protein PKW90_03725 [Myxococcota bacterium]|nr:hypothetical protein [Myxococcota bacterium]